MPRTSPPHAPPRPPRPLLHLGLHHWPEADRDAFREAFEVARDVFDDAGGGARLKPRTKASIRFGYRRWLGWLSSHHPDLLALPPQERPTLQTVKAFVIHLRATCSARTVASQVGKLHDALRFMYPQVDWTWLRTLKTRLEAAVPRQGRKPITITSQRLFDASLARLDEVDLELAAATPTASRKHLQALALRYRDGLLVAMATLLPLRRSNLALLRIGTTIRRERNVWRIRIADETVKNDQPIDADLEAELSQRIDRYLGVYRPLIHASHEHDGFWASAKGCPAEGQALYEAFQKEARASVGLHLTLHDTRRIGATTWAVHDPVNAAGARDLLGNRSDRVFAQHYNLANGIEASRAMARVRMRLKQRR